MNIQIPGDTQHTKFDLSLNSKEVSNPTETNAQGAGLGSGLGECDDENIVDSCLQS